MDLGLKETSSNTACFRAQTELSDAFSHILGVAVSLLWGNGKLL